MSAENELPRPFAEIKTERMGEILMLIQSGKMEEGFQLLRDEAHATPKEGTESVINFLRTHIIRDDTPIEHPGFILAGGPMPPICAYCGKPSKTLQSEYIVSRYFWGSQPVPASCPKLLVCRECNNYWLANERYVSTLIALCEQSKNPIAIEKCKTASAIEFFKMDVGFRDAYLSAKLFPQSKITKDGELVRKKELHIDRGRLSVVIGKIARGLYFWERHEVSPDSYHVSMILEPEMLSNPIATEMANSYIDVSGLYGFNDNVFQVRRLPKRPDEIHTASSIYEFNFYTGFKLYAWLLETATDKVDFSHPSKIGHKHVTKKVTKPPKSTPSRCAYCGKTVTNWEDEHVVPQNLWGSRPLPTHCPKVPACHDCNHFYGEFEGFFRSSMALDTRTTHPIALEMRVPGGVIDSHARNDAKFKRQITALFKPVQKFNESGSYEGLEWTGGFLTDMTPIFCILGKIARGLYFAERRSPAPHNYGCTIANGKSMEATTAAKAPEQLKTIQDMLKAMHEFSTFFGYDDSVFSVRRLMRLAEPESPLTTYEFTFYSNIVYFVYIMPIADPLDDPSHPLHVAQSVAKKQGSIKAKSLLPPQSSKGVVDVPLNWNPEKSGLPSGSLAIGPDDSMRTPSPR